MQDVPTFDPKDFKFEAFIKRNEKPWGYELHFVREDLPYMVKLMHINEGHRQSLQIHDEKQETYVLIKGRAAVIWEDNTGKMVTTELEQFKGYKTVVGQKHRLCSITDCDIMEGSTPELGTTWRLEDDYSRPDETPEQRAKERA
jgi:mannose-6-phosphate isomerase-like protein (cupin superfamily)